MKCGKIVQHICLRKYENTDDKLHRSGDVIDRDSAVLLLLTLQ
jgi:hypothetical protein